MAKAGSRRLFNSEARVVLQVTNVVDEVALGQIFRRVLGFTPVIIIPPVLHYSLHLRVALSRRTNGEVWEPSGKINAVSKIGELQLEKYFNLFLHQGLTHGRGGIYIFCVFTV